MNRINNNSSHRAVAAAVDSVALRLSLGAAEMMEKSKDRGYS